MFTPSTKRKSTAPDDCIHQAGFTMVEILVAILIFSIGLLGLASLQVVGYKLSSDSLYRTMAAILANDMIDRMRTNTVETAKGVTSAYNNPGATSAGNPACLGKNSGGGTLNTSCTSSQMAMEDFYEWYASLQGVGATAWYPAVTAQLPSASGVVCVDSTPNDGSPGSFGCDNVVAVAGKPIYAIKIWWVERKDAKNPGVQHQYVTSFSL